MSSTVVLKGKLENYSCKRGEANFISDKAEQSSGSGAIAAAAAGESGVAMSLIVASGDAKEEADYVQFTVSGRVIEGWLKQSPFTEGDLVEVVVEEVPQGLELMAIVRPHDRVIALRPYLYMGQQAYIFHVLKWWGGVTTIFVLLFNLAAFFLLSEGPNRLSFFDNPARVGMLLLVDGVLALITFLAFLVWVVKLGNPRARDAERVFRALGWSNVHRINLMKTSKKMARGGEPFGYGLDFFRY